MKCNHCESENLDIRQVGQHYELFCVDCLEFLTFLDKRKAERFKTIKAKNIQKG